jgi:hypothetical protein
MAEATRGFTRARNVVTGKEYRLSDLELKPKESFVLLLLK